MRTLNFSSGLCDVQVIKRCFSWLFIENQVRTCSHVILVWFLSPRFRLVVNFSLCRHHPGVTKNASPVAGKQKVMWRLLQQASQKKTLSEIITVEKPLSLKRWASQIAHLAIIPIITPWWKIRKIIGTQWKDWRHCRQKLLFPDVGYWQRSNKCHLP